MAKDGHPCNDANKCTFGDMCLRGVCTGFPKCVYGAGPCKDNFCDPRIGERTLSQQLMSGIFVAVGVTAFVEASTQFGARM
jgi:hypothetical protein